MRLYDTPLPVQAEGVLLVLGQPCAAERRLKERHIRDGPAILYMVRDR